jgi:type I restriction enzyme R subunit
MNEAETRAEHIDPALRAAGWGVLNDTRIAREFKITQGRLEGKGKRGTGLIADYILTYRNRKIAVVEAKAWDKPVSDGIAQAKFYADQLQIPFAFSTNGREIYSTNMLAGTEATIDAFPSPDELWNQVFTTENSWRDRFSAIPNEDKSGSHTTRYYQDIAVERVLDAISTGQKRILLTLATGTGKTFIAFQLAWKLFHSRWNLSGMPTRRPRILFLAERNILADQAFNAFSSFQQDVLVRIQPSDIRKKGRVPTNGNIFFTIFQTFMAEGGVDYASNIPYFGEYPPDFFDFIMVDECHRGGAKDESSWRDILDYFSSAVQLGLTATPKRTDNVDTYAYFGEPVYTYSLKQGINDGFLTPFRVKQIDTTLDSYIYTADDRVLEGQVEDGRTYTESDFNRNIEIQEREAYRVNLILENINQNEKTLVFCADQNHALFIRDLINQRAISRDPNYCHRVTADDGEIGEKHLRDFQDNERTIPTVLTTSQKLSTGVDARNIRNIILLRPVNSMIEFKQIIGRGTRLFDGKDYFTLFDFVNAHKHFADPEWDGEPQPPEPGPIRPPVVQPEPTEGDDGDDDGGDDPDSKPKRPKVKIKLADGKERNIQHMICTSFWHPDGRPMSAAEFVNELFGNLKGLFSTEEELRALWSDPATRKKLLESLEEKNIGADQLAEMQAILDAADSDIYDVLAHIAYAVAPVTRDTRAAVARTRVASKFDGKKQEFLEFVLEHYVQDGVQELDTAKLTPLLKLKYGNSIHDALRHLGDVNTVSSMFNGFQRYLYEPESASESVVYEIR